MEYTERVAVVTGAGSGIGRALTVELSRRGARVAASDVDKEGLAETADACRGDVRTYELDVADRAAVLRHAEEVRDELGPAQLVFNNAGVGLAASVEETRWEDFDWLMGINLGGVVNGTGAFLPQLVESGTPDGPSHLVNVSSIFGLISYPYQSAYNAAKYAVRGYTEALRQEMLIGGRPVEVHCVHPGFIRTNIAGNSRMSDSLTPTRDASIAAFRRRARTTPDRAAHIILRGVERNRPRILVGADAVLVGVVPRLLGARYQDVLAFHARRGRRHGAGG